MITMNECKYLLLDDPKYSRYITVWYNMFLNAIRQAES